jgi:hypothetical protein
MKFRLYDISRGQTHRLHIPLELRQSNPNIPSSEHSDLQIFHPLETIDPSPRSAVKKSSDVNRPAVRGDHEQGFMAKPWLFMKMHSTVCDV